MGVGWARCACPGHGWWVGWCGVGLLCEGASKLMPSSRSELRTEAPPAHSHTPIHIVYGTLLYTYNLSMDGSTPLHTHIYLHIHSLFIHIFFYLGDLGLPELAPGPQALHQRAAEGGAGGPLVVKTGGGERVEVRGLWVCLFITVGMVVGWWWWDGTLICWPRSVGRSAYDTDHAQEEQSKTRTHQRGRRGGVLPAILALVLALEPFLELPHAHPEHQRAAPLLRRLGRRLLVCVY